MTNKRGQLAIFVIIAIVIVAGILVYFAVKGSLFVSQISPEFRPVYDLYSECIQQQTRDAIDLAESQGGWVYLPDYSPGSQYAPSSSQLNFLGFPVPYWYYVSGNGLIKEQVPTIDSIQQDISRYVAERVNSCDFGKFYAQGFYITLGEPKVSVKIQDTTVAVDVSAAVTVSKENNSAIKSDDSVEINSKIGKFYNLAKEIYDKQKDEAFLENYSTDLLRSYAPVDGVDLSCSPKIWKTREVVNDVKSALEANIAAIKFKGGYYTLNKEENKYFVVNQPVDEAVNLIYNRNWPTKLEITGADDELMVATPVGNQEGLGVMGFCYAPYHFVYDLSFTVLMQVYDGQEIFQFPVVVVIDKNVPRKAVFSEFSEETNFDLCEFKTQDISVNLFDVNLNRVDSNVSYGCFDQQCLLGESKNGVFTGKAPSCINGYVLARADGYAEKRQLYSSNEEVTTDLILDKEYEVETRLEVGGSPLSGTAIVTFSGARTVSTALHDNDKMKLSEGLYNVTVYVYGNSNITIPSSTKTQCVQVPQTGIFGFFGGTKEQCIDITIPETKIESALIGGGKSEIYLLPSDLEKGKMTIKVDSFGAINSLEQMQYNFESFDQSGVNLEFE